jgi:hypothetical protein
MIMRPNGKKRSIAASTGRLTMSACAVLVGLAAAASAQAHARPLSVVTNEDPAQPGEFTLTFGGLGLNARSNISTTNYELSVDPVRGAARFVRYRQQVQPLTLPGGISTGDITVEIVDGSSAGSFDALTRTFTTSEMYAVHFTGDLSAFGLTSPVLLPSSSTGELALTAVGGGEVTMDWNGSGELFNPLDPSTPLVFTYACKVNTLFPATPANMVGLALTPDVVGLQLPQGIERSLVAKLDQSLAQIQRGNGLRAAQSLRTFIKMVDLLSGRVIDEADAADLIAGATEAIDLIGLVGPRIR